MRFINDYKRIKSNYRSLTFFEKFIVWTRFKTTPLNEVLKLIPSKGKILDLGCGIGLISYFMAFKHSNLKIIGIDPSKTRIKTANNVFKKPENLNFYNYKIENMIESDFDVILLIDVLYLLSREELSKTLSLCFEKLKRGGILVIKEMNKDHYLQYLLTIIPSIVITKFFNFFGSKSLGFRKNTPRYYRSNDFKKILEKNNWKIDIYKIPSRNFIYPHVIYFCKK